MMLYNKPATTLANTGAGLSVGVVTGSVVAAVVLIGVGFALLRLGPRLAIEPVHAADGTRRWCLTKNGQPVRNPLRRRKRQ